MGAQQLPSQGGIRDINHGASRKMAQDAQDFFQRSGVSDEYHFENDSLSYKGKAGDATANAARRFHDSVNATPLVDDFSRMWRSGSVVAQKLAYDLLENSAGIVRNNRSAAMIKEHYEKKLLGSFMPAYQKAYSAWARSNGIGKWDQIWSAQARERFNRELVGELNARAFDGPDAQRSVHPAVKEAADAHDRWSATDIEVGKGRVGEDSIKGYENLNAYSGYFSQKWSGSKMARLIQSGRYTRKQIRDAIAEGYVAKHGVQLSDAQVWADAVMRRSMASDRGSDMNLIGILQQDGRAFLEEMLENSGHSRSEIDKLIDRLTGLVEQRGQQGHTKGRVDIDLRTRASNGIDIMDLVDTDVARIVQRRARGTAGQAALARKGIRSKADQTAIKEAIKQEQQARGQSQKTGDAVTDFVDSDRHLTDEDIDAVFSYFDAGPIAGGLSPTISRIKKLTNLALLNQLGLTQIAETGVQIAAVGWKRWLRHADEGLKAAMRNPDSPLVTELKHMNVLVPEEKMFRDDMPVEMDRLGPTGSEFMQKVDHLLNTGQRVQGYMSGFYHVRKAQQRIAVTSAADKIMTNMKGLANDLTPERARDIGLDTDTFNRIKQYVDNGTVEFRDGHLHKMNMDRWDPVDAEDFALSMNRHVYQVVQRAMAGESSYLFHKDGLAALFMHLKSFPLLALNKQAYRNLRISDEVAMQGFMLGLATAGVSYSVKQVVNGRTDRLSPEQVAKGAFGLSNMAGWIPMWTDPLAGMLGMDSLRFNSYARGIEENVISTPAALPTANRVLNLPGALLDVATGSYTNSDIRALQATPIIGNAYGFTAIFNAMKE
ncbi:hypothetical protein HW532_20850 [Kaustia mangrovi]|uniref:Internal virion protein n=1 Tax=Kaustia mangrovi TaxID=2593653 RepID=A0A7S8C809_9HYPH|nr:hypothetical protein [Kaustia mangrovi]QPC44929.1 hypothetical protein HW532_20850 [Kaustia mangrovi]